MAAVRMELARILIRELADMQIIELREAEAADPDAARSFPIVIGLPEAQAIERRLKGTPLKRPQTHDLLANLIGELGATLESITVSELREHTFYATLDIRTAGGEALHVDSRPSDAIALGVAQGVAIYVEEEVLESALRDGPEV
jgi:uncharacterized protein